MTRRTTMTAIALGTALGLASLVPARAHDGEHGKKEQQPATVTVTLTDSGYEPATIELTAGKPARLAFRNEADSTCATTVESKELGVARTALPKGETTVVEIEPAKPGEYTFACSMGMVKGTVLVKSES